MTNKITVLAIDDEPNNLRALKLDLEDECYEVLTADDGIPGWNVLQQHKDTIQVILLDRMMPNMDGIQFMEKLKLDDTVSNIPVIMQTAAAEKKQVVEGIQAGAYYYLTKPYDKDVLLTIVAAAISEYAQYSDMRMTLQKYRTKLHLRESTFVVQVMDDAKYLATFLANYFPEPDRAVFGILELLINAIEHGNLNINYEEKSKLTSDGKWTEEIQQRLALPENRDKKVLVNFTKHDKEITLRITDEGNGFDWKEYLEISPDRAMHHHGRGIAMSKLMSFDSLEFIGYGNEVVCKVYLPAS